MFKFLQLTKKKNNTFMLKYILYGNEENVTVKKKITKTLVLHYFDLNSVQIYSFFIKLKRKLISYLCKQLNGKC